MKGAGGGRHQRLCGGWIGGEISLFVAEKSETSEFQKSFVPFVQEASYSVAKEGNIVIHRWGNNCFNNDDSQAYLLFFSGPSHPGDCAGAK
jgi:hypothetical protein